MLRVLFLLLLNVFLFFSSSAQGLRDTFLILDKQLKEGNKQALYILSTYINDTTTFVDHWQHGSFETTVREKAIEIVQSETLFLPGEYNWEDSSTTFKSFLDSNYSKIFFDSITEKILITPVNNRITSYKLYEYDYPDLLNIDSLVMSLDRDGENSLKEFQELLERQDNRSLSVLASMFYNSTNHRYGSLHRGGYERIFGMLTNVLVRVQNTDDEWIWTYETDYDASARLNNLIYWATHYRDYRWSKDENRFVNEKEPIQKKPGEMKLLTDMLSGDSSVALDAFVKMTYVDPIVLEDLPIKNFADDMNSSLPIFKESFLKSLSQFTVYFRKNNVSLELKGRVRRWFNQLSKDDFSFKERYKLENEIFSIATADEITVLEYWFLVYEENWDMTFSAGRIIDKFYSFNWNTIVHNTTQLDHYLKKAALLDRLGIIGNCNKYLKKFSYIDKQTRANLLSISSHATDEDIKASADTALRGITVIYDTLGKKFGDANKDCLLDNLEKEYKKELGKKHESYEQPLSKLTSCISYPQIPDWITLLERKNKLDEVYNFLENDFGFPVDVENVQQRVEFLRMYKKLSYEKMCRYYLDQLGLPYKKADGSLDYQAIYEMLAFDIVDPLSGGGGGNREDGIYLVIKLLEFEFKSTLGYPKKLCNGGGVYRCGSLERAIEWINFLRKKNLIKPFVKMPLSISRLNFRK